MSRRLALLIPLLGCLSSPVLAEEIFAPDKKVETDVTACLADARAKAPDATDHNRRVLMATACVCDAHKELCRSGIPQDGHLRQRINEDK